MKKIAITGGTGFIGSLLVKRHLNKGDYVRVLTRNNKNNNIEHGNVDYYYADITDDTCDLNSFFDGIDVFYNCAGVINDTSKMRAVHVEGTQRLVNAAIGKIRRWVQLSSVGTYGTHSEGVITERTKLAPMGEYEITKTESDQIVIDTAHKYGLKFSILRPSNVFGNNMTNMSLFGLIAMVNKGIFFYIGKKNAMVNYVHVDNVVKALELCAIKIEAENQIYNLSDCCSLKPFIEIIANTLDVKTPKLHMPEILLKFVAAIFSWLPSFPLTSSRIAALTNTAVYSDEKIYNELCFESETDVNEGILNLTKYWKSLQ